jgi:hypothetical protein
MEVIVIRSLQITKVVVCGVNGVNLLSYVLSEKLCETYGVTKMRIHMDGSEASECKLITKKQKI